MRQEAYVNPALGQKIYGTPSVVDKRQRAHRDTGTDTEATDDPRGQ
jgi:hypothetical protein